MRLLVSPVRAPLDESVAVRLDGLGAGASVTVRARMRGYLGQTWSAAASFAADAAGTVDLGHDAPHDGSSYDGVDAMGLFWSMRPESGPGEAFAPDAPLRTTVTAEVNGQVVGSATVERLIFADDVVRSRVREDGLVGAYFRPQGDGPYPGVLVMGGSGGALRGSYWQAAVLARHGFAALALAYFGTESLPPYLSSISLEYFETALNWLARQPGVRAGGTGVIGTSRGGELALLLGATFPSISAVVGYVPSHVVWGGLAPNVPPPQPSWTWRGEPLPTLRRLRPGEAPPPPPPPGVPIALTPGFLRALEGRADDEARAAIPVERIGGPVLLISGEDDQMWPSALMAERAAARLAAHNHPYPVTHLAYAGAGHAIFLPHLPTTVTASVHPIGGGLNDFGGTPAANAHAATNSWPRVVRFLAESLSHG